MRVFLSVFVLSIIISSCTNQANENNIPYIDLSGFEDGIHHWELYSEIRSNERLDTNDVIGIADNLLAYQNEDGGWPKNIDWLAKITPDSVINSLTERYQRSTFDNRNTFPQIEYLAAVYHYSKIEKYKTAALKGFNYILETQFPGGGWRGWDAPAITFNDDVMTGIMKLLLDVKTEKEIYDWLDNTTRQKLVSAYKKGLLVILKSQIEVDGTKTAWCQQHDPLTYQPVQGRSYELPSITVRESSDVVLFLMEIPNPDQPVKEAIRSAVEWFERSKITGYRYATISIAERPYHQTTVNFDREFVPDENAKPVWARYYDLENSEPFLCRRSGEVVFSLDSIPFDRRIGYDWYGFWPEQVLSKYSEWKKQ
ncbi:MAG: pectate lyase [Prolixibacteraceae bacterium]|jgi:PelA/Pel-15E family pectate lyase|nr:pectate lyase [Prolixibacteraceae bacterium]